MKDLIVGGTRVMVTDDVADALLDYVLALSVTGATAIAQFPALVEGRSAETRLIVGAGIPLMTISVDFGLPADVEGADFAAWEMRRRTAVVAGETTDVDWTGES